MVQQFSAHSVSCDKKSFDNKSQYPLRIPYKNKNGKKKKEGRSPTYTNIPMNVYTQNNEFIIIFGDGEQNLHPLFNRAHLKEPLAGWFNGGLYGNESVHVSYE